MYTKEDYVQYKDDIEMHDLTEDHKIFLDNINKQLMEIEKQLKKEAEILDNEAQKRVNDPNDWIEEYEIEASIDFDLDESDPDYDENTDNILVSLQYSLICEKESMNRKGYFGFVDGVDHNLYRYRDDHPLKDAGFHCWTYHELYDHTRLGWADILRIGTIWIDIDVVYQRIIKFENKVISL